MDSRWRSRNFESSRPGRTPRAQWARATWLATALLGVLLLAPAVAQAESLCTDTWTGPAEGPWSTAADWSAARVPEASDVACIGSGKTVSITEGARVASVVQGEGSLVISAGSLEVGSALEASTIKGLSVTGGTLSGAATVNVTGTFTGGEAGTMSGTGSTVIASGATGTISSSALYLKERTFSNVGTLTVAKAADLQGSGHAKLTNSGTLIVNGEDAGSNHGLIASAGEATVINTGTLKKTEGTGASPVEFAIENEGTVSATSGTLEIRGGGKSGEHATGSWSASGAETKILFNSEGTRGTTSLGATVPLSGAIEIVQGTVTAGKIEAPSATVTISGSFPPIRGILEVTGASASTIQNLTLTTSAEAGGELTGAAEIDVTHTLTAGGGSTLGGSGSTVIQSGATGSIGSSSSYGLNLKERTLKNAGTLTVGKGSGVVGNAKAQLLNSGTLIVNGEPSTSNHGLIASPGEATLINTGTLEKNEGTGKTVIGFALNNESAVIAFAGQLEALRGGVSGEKTAGSWTASGAGTAILFGNAGAETNLGAKVPMSGTIEAHGRLKAGKIEGATASLTLNNLEYGELGSLELTGASPSRLQNLTMTGTGKLTGSGELEVASSFTARGGAGMSGSGTTRFLPGSTANFIHEEFAEFTLENGRRLINEGTMTVEKEETFKGGKIEPDHVELVNQGLLVVNGEPRAANHGLTASEPSHATLVNEGILEKNAGTGKTPIEWKVENYGPIEERTGEFEFDQAPFVSLSEQRACQFNASTPNHEITTQSEGYVCPGGNFSETQTDFKIGGRGVGLNLLRTYNSQAAAEKATGPFGYGWSSSFSDHITISGAVATFVAANGGTTQFLEGGEGTFTPLSDSQDTLTGSSSAGYTLTLPYQTVYRFAGASGRLESVTDRSGNATTLTYNGSGQLEKITDPGERTLTFTYKEGLVESVSGPKVSSTGERVVVKYTYSEGNLATVTQPGEAALRWQLKYDASHQLTELVDGRGGKTINEYSSNQLVKKTDPMTRITKYEYGPLHTQIKNEATGAITQNYYARDGQPVAITRGYGTEASTTERFIYAKSGDLRSLTDGNGHTTKYSYDTHGNRLTMVDPNEHETKWTYNSTHDVTSETKPGGEKTTYIPSSFNPETVERPAPAKATQIAKYGYDAHGQQTSMEDPLKRVWKYEYNPAGDRKAETDPEGDKRTWTYGESSDELTTVSPRGHVKEGEEAKYTTKTDRDAQGRPTLVTDPLKHETKFTYDGNGNLETKTDPEAHKTVNTYNLDNERTKVEEPTKTITETGYDGAGRVTSQKDGNKHTTTYTRNVLEQVTETSDPLKRTSAEGYDKAGNPIKVTDALTRTTTRKYDPANQLTEVTYSDGKTPTVKYEYNADGKRTKLVDGTGATTYEYDQLSRLTKSEDGHKGVVSYEYDLANQQTKITYPNGKAITRGFDNAGRLTSVTDWAEHLTKFGYDADSDVTTTTFPAGTTNVDTYAYDETDAMKEVKMAKGAETLASLVYTRTKDGQVKGVTSKGLPGPETFAHTYDANGRLTKGSGASYKYDEGNNPTTIGTGTYTYDVANELEKGTPATYKYDEVGERTKTTPTSGTATTYGYDQAGHLTAVTRPKGETTPAIEDTYAYNGDGLRTSQIISGTESNFAWDLSAPLPLTLSDGTDNYVYGPGALPVEQLSSEGTPSYLHHDQQGSTRMLTSGTGASTGTATYDAYGNKTGTAASPLGYDGQYSDADTGLIYLRARMYDPATVQFMTSDPAQATSLSPYGYARNDPVNEGDPTGLTPWSPRVKAAIAKCRAWQAWHSSKSPYYAKQHGKNIIYNACNFLLHVPSEVFHDARAEKEEACFGAATITGEGAGWLPTTPPGRIVIGGLAGVAFQAGCELGAGL
jgi:RHS repeat-associated protein